jgi:hypothetical protein
MNQKLEMTSARQAIIDAAIPEYLSVGLSTEPADFETAKETIAGIYDRIGRKRPYFVQLDSPLAAELYIQLYCEAFPGEGTPSDRRTQLGTQLGTQLVDQLVDQLWDQLGTQLWDQLVDQLQTQLVDQLGTQLRAQLRNQLWDQLVDQLRTKLVDQLVDQLGAQLRNQLWDQLVDQLGTQLRTQLVDQLRNQLWDQLQTRPQNGAQSPRDYMGTWFWGSQDAYAWGFYDTARRMGVVYPPEVDTMLNDQLTVSRSIGWWYPFDDMCILTNRPVAIHRDDSNRLHSTEGPALKYRDGYALYAVHGVQVPHWVIEDRAQLTVEQIENETNAEIKRVMVELFGQDRYVLESGATIISQDEAGILYRRDMGDDEPIVMVRVLNSTPEPDGTLSRDDALKVFGNIEVNHGGVMTPLSETDSEKRYKEYMIRVPPTMTTPLEAVSWTFGLEAKDYRPDLQS